MAETAGKKRRVVKYAHPHSFTSRVISADDWAGVGAGGQETIVWNIDNGWAVPAEKFSAEALEYIARDGDLTLVEV